MDESPILRGRGVNHAVDAWAKLLPSLLLAQRDPKTVGASARMVGLSVSSFKARCRQAGVTAKATVDHVRVLRACLLSRSSGLGVGELLDVAEPRTLQRLLVRVGLPSRDEPGAIAEWRTRALPAALAEALLRAAKEVRLATTDLPPDLPTV